MIVVLFFALGFVSLVMFAMIYGILNRTYRDHPVRYVFETSTRTAAGSLRQQDVRIGDRNRQSVPMMKGHNHEDHLQRVQRIQVR